RPRSPDSSATSSSRSSISSCCRPSLGSPSVPSGKSRKAGQSFRAMVTIRSGANTEMKLLGISAHYHDSAAALVTDGVPFCAVQEERLSRRKGDAAFPAGAIEWCLDHAGLSPDDLDAVVFYERSMLKFERILTCALRALSQS